LMAPSSRLLIESQLSGLGRIRVDTVRLQGVNRRYIGRNWECYSSEAWNFHSQ
jgi:hypothetical protein